MPKAGNAALMRVSGIVDESIVDGPGLRYVVFTQGCPHHCKGCHNPQTHSFEGGFLLSAEAALAQLQENPLLDSFELTLTSASADKELLDSFIAAVGRIDGVDRVSYPAQMAERLHATVGKIRLVLLLFGGALLVISLILLSNTIRLAIFSKRYLINTMKLVGATKWFIMRPFLGSSLTQGILAGTAASALFGLAVYGLNEAVPELMTIAEAGKIAIILGSMIAGGIIISGLFTFAALNKFINMKSNKIYLY